MAIQPLDQRLDQMMPAEEPQADMQQSPLLPSEATVQTEEPVQVAGLGTAFVKAAKVIKKGISPADAAPATAAERLWLKKLRKPCKTPPSRWRSPPCLVLCKGQGSCHACKGQEASP